MKADNTEKRDILLHFDEKANDVVVYTVESNSVQHIRGREFDGARISTVSLQEKTADEAEKYLGSVVFALIDKLSSKKIGIRNYEFRIESALQEYVAELEKLVLENDGEACYRLGLERHREAMTEKSKALLEEADRLLSKSAMLGYDDAREYIANEWPQLREVILMRIDRG